MSWTARVLLAATPMLLCMALYYGVDLYMCVLRYRARSAMRRAAARVVRRRR